MIDTEKTYEHILFEQDDAVAYVTMNRPKKRMHSHSSTCGS